MKIKLSVVEDIEDAIGDLSAQIENYQEDLREAVNLETYLNDNLPILSELRQIISIQGTGNERNLLESIFEGTVMTKDQVSRLRCLSIQFLGKYL